MIDVSPTALCIHALITSGTFIVQPFIAEVSRHCSFSFINSNYSMLITAIGFHR